MATKTYAVIVTIAAIILAVLASMAMLQKGGLGYLVMMHRFFDTILPVLGIGALLKYLFTSYNRK